MKFRRARKPQEHAPTDHGAIKENIDLVLKMEHDFLARRSFKDRLADLVGDFSGSMLFVLSHALIFLLYFLVNTALIPGIRPFDPFPFPLLSMVVSVEAIFLSVFVLMKQNRMSRRAAIPAHIDFEKKKVT